MASTVYPNIHFIKNENLCLIGSQLTPNIQSSILLHPSDPLIQIYTNLVQKLFSQITILKQMLWICKIPSTSIIRIYFSQPYQYPATYCCKEPIYLELEHDLTGSFTCSKCRKIVTKFVHSIEADYSDEEIFKRKQKELKNRKENMRQLLTSQKFRAKNLKNNFFKETIIPKNGGFVIQINDKSLREQNTSHETQFKGQQHLQQLRTIINDIFS